MQTLEGLVKQKKGGKSVSEEDVPPVISVTSKTSLKDVSPRTESHDQVSSGQSWLTCSFKHSLNNIGRTCT